MRLAWPSGELAKLHPDRVKGKRSADDDASRAKLHVESVEIDGVKFGDMPIASIRVEHCERVMAALPKSLAPASRRQVAQLMARVLGLAFYPLRVINTDPLPKGFLPRLGQKKAKTVLYPDEERQLLGCKTVPLEHRVLYGVLAREGMRKGEALGLTWKDIDLERSTPTRPTTRAHGPSLPTSCGRWRS